MINNKEEKQHTDNQLGSVKDEHGVTDIENTTGKSSVKDEHGVTDNENTNGKGSIKDEHGVKDNENTNGKGSVKDEHGVTDNENTNGKGSDVDEHGMTDNENTNGKSSDVNKHGMTDNENTNGKSSVVEGATYAENFNGESSVVQGATYAENFNGESSVDATPGNTDANRTEEKPAGEGRFGCNPNTVLSKIWNTKVVPFFKEKGKGLSICYQENEGRIFQKFCTQFLPPDLPLKELDSEQARDVRLLMVLILPSVNRQNNVEVLCSYIRKLKKKYHLDDKREFTLVQISFDGNNSINPPNLVKGSTFATLKAEFEFNLVSCIDIIYRDEYDFENCEINEKAARNLISLSKRK